MGAVWNFNRVFELAHGEYFMWAAFDDLRELRYVSACVSALELHADAVLCASDVTFIDEDGRRSTSPLQSTGSRRRNPTDRCTRQPRTGAARVM